MVLVADDDDQVALLPQMCCLLLSRGDKTTGRIEYVEVGGCEFLPDLLGYSMGPLGHRDYV
jgi:hypothetical protein